jgi:Fe-S-cluster-containing dehydrogenase component
MAQFGMVVDLQRCVGCGACALACKAENNTRARTGGQSHNWLDFLLKTEGVFPDTVHTAMPVMCNHCTDAPCVAVCPVTPKAMFKTPEGVTLHDPDLCIGCRLCQNACPYSTDELDQASLEGETYSVISFNRHEADVRPEWSDETAMIPGVTSSGIETAEAAGATPPTANQFTGGDAHKAGVVGKCTFCHHRTSNGLQPACVEVCPSKALIFGDQDDPESDIAKVLKAQESFRLQEEKGTKPNVHYIGKYSVRG